MPPPRDPPRDPPRGKPPKHDPVDPRGKKDRGGHDTGSVATITRSDRGA
jgi:hypothetical protein